MTILTVYQSVAVATRLAVIVADALVIVLTWIKTWGTYREALRHGFSVPLASLLLRDGALFSHSKMSHSLRLLSGTLTFL